MINHKITNRVMIIGRIIWIKTLIILEDGCSMCVRELSFKASPLIFTLLNHLDLLFLGWCSVPGRVKWAIVLWTGSLFVSHFDAGFIVDGLEIIIRHTISVLCEYIWVHYPIELLSCQWVDIMIHLDNQSLHAFELGAHPIVNISHQQVTMSICFSL